MPYEAEISRVNPTCFLFLVDQSGLDGRALRRRSPARQGQESPRPSTGSCRRSSSAVAKAVHSRPLTISAPSATARTIARPAGAALGRRRSSAGQLIGNSPLRIEERVRSVERPRHEAGRRASCGLCQSGSRQSQGKTLDVRGPAGGPRCDLPLRRRTSRLLPPTVNQHQRWDSFGRRPTAAAERFARWRRGTAMPWLFNIHISRRGKAGPLSSSESCLADEHARLLFACPAPCLQLCGTRRRSLRRRYPKGRWASPSCGLGLGNRNSWISERS